MRWIIGGLSCILVRNAIYINYCRLFILDTFIYFINFQNLPECVFLNLLVYMWVCDSVGLYGTSWPNEKRYRPEIWNTYSRRPYLKTSFFVFSKQWPRGPLASKNSRVIWIPVHCLVIFLFNHMVGVFGGLVHLSSKWDVDYLNIGSMDQNKWYRLFSLK